MKACLFLCSTPLLVLNTILELDRDGSGSGNALESGKKPERVWEEGDWDNDLEKGLR